METLLLVMLVAVIAAGGALLWARHDRRTDEDTQRRLVETLRQDLQDQRDGLVRQVLDVAGERLERHVEAGQHDLARRDQVVGQQLEGMHRQLDQVRDLVGHLGEQRERGYGELTTRLTEAQKVTADLSRTTDALVKALGSSPSRGRWGERLAEDVLRHAGFVEGISYLKQTSTGRGRPDFTFPLPGDRCLHMDVKFPLDNYLAHLEATDEDARARHLRAFLKDVRSRINELAGRDYIDPANGTLDQVLLFLPNEQLYGFVHEQDPTVMDLAMQRRVVLCSPLTLFSVLAVVRQAVDDHVAERRSGEILELLAGFTTQWDKFTERLERLDAQLTTVRRTFDDVNGPRRRQLERQLDRVDDLRDDASRQAASVLALPRPADPDHHDDARVS